MRWRHYHPADQCRRRLIVGVLQHDLSIEVAAKNYTLLTIGDGLVAQIPALVISTAAGIVVSRVSSDENIGQQLVGSYSSNRRSSC